jgi:DNA-binding LacI/PurR family transcriptional regulator
MSYVARRRPSIHDVAHEAGVSITTVSHALNGRGRVQPGTRDRVLEIAARLGYSANVHAQRLATGSNQAIALQVSGYGKNIVGVDSAYYIELLNGASAKALDLGYMPMLAPPELHREFGELPADGAVIIDPTGSEPLLHSIAENGGVVVTAGRPLKDSDPVTGWVDNDLPAVTIEVMDHLKAQGYVRPGVLTGPKNRSYSADTITAYNQWAAERGIKASVTALRGNPTAELAIRKAKELLSGEDPPDAIYTSFDVFALGILRAADELGIKVPEELGIVATVDSEALRSASVPLTAIENHPRQIGSEAIELLVGLIRGEREGPAVVTIPAELKVRASTMRNG